MRRLRITRVCQAILGKPASERKEEEGVEKNTTVITLDKFNYRGPCPSSCSISAPLLGSPSRVERKRLVEKEASRPSRSSIKRVTRLFKPRKRREPFEFLIDPLDLSRLFIASSQRRAISPFPRRQRCVTRLKIGEKSYFDLISPLRPERAENASVGKG